MKLRIKASINVAKITKERIRTVDKNNKPFKNGAKYLDVTIFIDTDEVKFGNHMSMVEEAPKGEREGPKNYIANGKITFTDMTTKAPPSSDTGSEAPAAPAGSALSGDPDDLPF